MNVYLKIILKSIISLFFVFIVFEKIDFNLFFKELHNIKLTMLILAALLYFSTMFFSTLRWAYFIKTKKKFIELFKLYMTGTFFNLFMPGTVGGDVIKAYYLYKEDKSKGDSLVSVFMERYMGLCALITIATLGIIVIYEKIKETFIVKIFFIICIMFIIGSFFAVFFPYELFYKKLEKVRVSIKKYMFNLDTVIKTYLLSLIVQGIGVFVVYVLGVGLSIELSLKYYLIFIPIITVVSMIPISFSGFGVREYSFLYLFGAAGVSKEKAVGLSLMWFLTMLITGFLGMFFYFSLTKKRIK